jgi:hypothetical protein
VATAGRLIVVGLVVVLLNVAPVALQVQPVPQALFAVSVAETLGAVVEIRVLGDIEIEQVPVDAGVESVQLTESVPSELGLTNRLVDVQVRVPADAAPGASIQAAETAIARARLRVRSICMGRAFKKRRRATGIRSKG